MDNFTHSLTGWALGQAGLKRKSRKGLAALILGANMPDIDVLFGWVSWGPLAMHRGFTHGLVGGVLVMPPLLAGLLWLLDRWQVGRGAAFDERAADALRLARRVELHRRRSRTPLLDLQTTYAVQLLSPLSDRCGSTTTRCSSSTSGCGACLAFAIWLSRRREAQADKAGSDRPKSRWPRSSPTSRSTPPSACSAKRALTAAGQSLIADALFAVARAGAVLEARAGVARERPHRARGL